MKKILSQTKAIIASILLLSMAACVDLEEEPVDFVAPETFYKTESQINAAIAAAWGFLSGYWSDYDWNMYNMTGHADDVDDGSNSLQLENMQTSTTLRRYWADYYRGIASMNNALASLENIDISAEEKQLYEGQLRFTRAFHYYMLVRLWGGVPLATEALTPEELQVLERASRDEVYEYIVADLEQAADLLPPTWPEGSGARPTKTSTKGMLATVYLTWATLTGDNAKYTMARDLAKEVMDSGQHALVENINDVFLEENQFASEFLLAVQRINQVPFAATDPQIWTPEAYLDGWSAFSVDTVLQNQYPEQPRKYAYLLVGTPEEDGSFTPFADGRWYCRKYIPPYISMEDYNALRSPANTPLLRYPEILLCYAEADNHLNGPQPEAVEALNSVRNRANNYLPNPDAPLLDAGTISQEAFKNEILKERFYELNFEHVRIFDLLRHRMLQDANPNNPDYSEDDYLFPIPLVEVEETEGRVKQNPGYDDLGYGFYNE